MKQLDKRLIEGWIAVGFSTIITRVWAFWGIIENFYEGWQSESNRAHNCEFTSLKWRMGSILPGH